MMILQIKSEVYLGVQPERYRLSGNRQSKKFKIQIFRKVLRVKFQMRTSFPKMYFKKKTV